MKRRQRFTVLAFALLFAIHDAGAQDLLRLVPKRTISGSVQMSVGKDTPIVFVSLDLAGPKGVYDRNLEAFYVLELEPGVAKPVDAKGVGTIIFKQHESLTVTIGATRLHFARTVPVSSDPKGTEKRIVDLVEARRSPVADKPILHSEMAAQFLAMPHGPFVKRPR